MDVAAERLTERLVDHAASACFGGAVAFAAYAAMAPIVALPALAALTAAAGALAYAMACHLLGRIERAASAAPLDELLLDEALVAPDGNSTLVRLFDPAAMPTSRQIAALTGRMAIDPSLAAPPDASQALRDALGELRRSLR